MLSSVHCSPPRSISQQECDLVNGSRYKNHSIPLFTPITDGGKRGNSKPLETFKVTAIKGFEQLKVQWGWNTTTPYDLFTLRKFNQPFNGYDNKTRILVRPSQLGRHTNKVYSFGRRLSSPSNLFSSLAHWHEQCCFGLHIWTYASYINYIETTQRSLSFV